MNFGDAKYRPYTLVKEMLETVEVVKNFNHDSLLPFVSLASSKNALFLTGEGSSRIFPAKRAIYSALRRGEERIIRTEGCTQALEYSLKDSVVIGASNSGQTKELIRLLVQEAEQGHEMLLGLTANEGTKLEEIAHKTYILGCGKEDAVAATKSVIEQALFYDSLLRHLSGRSLGDLSEVSSVIEQALTLSIPTEVTQTIANASMIYFAGKNTGVAEELRLKTNEITRKKSDYLEGTYALHGIEEVMSKGEVVVWIDPFEDEEEKIESCLVRGAGVSVVAISSRPTIFPTIQIPEAGEFQQYIELVTGWNVLVEVGIALGVNLDKPERARKVGNEFEG